MATMNSSRSLSLRAREIPGLGTKNFAAICRAFVLGEVPMAIWDDAVLELGAGEQIGWRWGDKYFDAKLATWARVRISWDADPIAVCLIGGRLCGRQCRVCSVHRPTHKSSGTPAAGADTDISRSQHRQSPIARAIDASA